MISPYLWHYFLIVPTESLVAANGVAPDLNNPDPIEDTFQRYPGPNEDGEYTGPATHYWAQFVATEDTLAPSKQALEEAVGNNPALSSIWYVRTPNRHHPSTTPDQVGIVVASNWAVFPEGSTVSNALVVEALGAA